MSKKRISETLKIEWNPSNEIKRRVYLTLDGQVIYNLAAKPIDDRLQGKLLVEALLEKGAVYNDENGEPAIQQLNEKTGKMTLLCHYQNGELQDPAVGEPAWQEFDAKTGKRTLLCHYQDGEEQDPAVGEPAYQGFDAKTGFLVEATSYNSEDITCHYLNEEELFELAKKKGMVPASLPKNLRKFQINPK